MSTIITRTGFCASCAKEDRPLVGTVCLIFGSKSNLYKAYHVGRRTQYKGFVPFVYTLEKVIGENVVGHRCCSVYGCGVTRNWNREFHCFIYETLPDHYERFIYPLENWNALISFKDFSYYI